MAQASPVPSAPQPGSDVVSRKQRSSTEKVVVWGGILLLLALVALQARARLGYTKTLEALQNRMEEDEGADANPLFVKDLNAYVYGWPARKAESKGKHLSTIELTWTGLPMTTPLGLIVECDPEEAQESGGTVMNLVSSGFVEPERKVAPPPFSEEEAAKFGSNIPAGAPGGAPVGDEANPEPAGATEPATEPAAATAEETPAAEPGAAEPTATESAAAEPATSEQPAAESPAAEAPATTEPAATEPAVEKPADQ